ncbi:hypothetical protein KY284_033050 [Solanum tuberosum]|nr:hypothetical protein KY284_033050 [Solanum tuberosum]
MTEKKISQKLTFSGGWGDHVGEVMERSLERPIFWKKKDVEVILGEDERGGWLMEKTFCLGRRT